MLRIAIRAASDSQRAAPATTTAQKKGRSSMAQAPCSLGQRKPSLMSPVVGRSARQAWPGKRRATARGRLGSAVPAAQMVLVARQHQVGDDPFAVHVADPLVQAA